jgi:uncharacterized membrane protein
MDARTKRRLGIVSLVLAVVFGVLNLKQTLNLGLTAVPVVFLIVGAVLMKKSREASK